MYLRFTLRARAAVPFVSRINFDLDEKIQVTRNVTLSGRGTYHIDEVASRARRPGIHYAVYAMTR